MPTIKNLTTGEKRPVSDDYAKQYFPTPETVYYNWKLVNEKSSGNSKTNKHKGSDEQAGNPEEG